VTRRIGLFGGSFDPVHVAHIAIAQTALSELDLDEVQLLPAADPWQRAPLTATAQQRLDMLALAVADLPGLTVNPVEIQRGGPTYTIDTLRALPDDAVYIWLLGTDQLSNFCSWRDWQDIVARVDLAVAARPGARLAAPPELQARLLATGRTLHRLSFAQTPVSASEIRRRLAKGESARGLVPAATLTYIQTHRLYH